MDAWIKILVVMFMMSALSIVIGYMLFDPFIGLILLGVILTLLVVMVEPVSGKAMVQVVIPLVILLFLFEIILNPAFTFDPWMLLVVGIVLYLMFTMFTGGGAMGGSLIDAKVALKLFPVYGLMIFVSMLIDPTFRTTIYIMVGSVGFLMVVYMAFLRGYDKWPEYQYGASHNAVAITDIDPKGKVRVGAEIWWAKVLPNAPPIREGEEVAVLGMRGMTMIVAREAPASELS